MVLCRQLQAWYYPYDVFAIQVMSLSGLTPSRFAQSDDQPRATWRSPVMPCKLRSDCLPGGIAVLQAPVKVKDRPGREEQLEERPLASHSGYMGSDW